MLQPEEARQLPKRTIAFVLAGGRGSRLRDLTNKRAKPGVPFGGKFRIVDFALSNCINSGIRRIYVATQYKAHSLIRHLQRGWSYLRPEMNEFVDIVPAQQRVNETSWYRGTADAVFQNIDILDSEGPDFILVLAGDHIYRMDYASMLEDHVASGAECTVGCVEVPREEATGFGVMAVNDGFWITDFLEKPADPPGMPNDPDKALASMGIYVFDAQFLYRLLEEDAENEGSQHDFGGDIIPALVARGKVKAHSLSQSAITSEGQAEPYWRDAGTVDSYWAANLDLVSVTPALDLYDRRWPIYTYQEQLPPAKFVFDDEGRRGMAVNSMVSGGCIISGAKVQESLLFSEVRVNSFAELTRCVILPGCNIGRGAKITNAVIDARTDIPEGLIVGEDAAADEARFFRSPGGVVLITREMVEALPPAEAG